ncbi:MAG: pilus assembly protein PilM [Clostridiales bacterium]|nr:pilus assembly protein PilM [Clostridiales bacterium]
MKLLIVKVEKYVLQIAEASIRGKKVILNKVRQFTLPEHLENGGYINATSGLVDFINSCILKGKLNRYKIYLLLGTNAVINKEFNHQTTKASHLSSLAYLEADAILPVNEGEFIIENYWYGKRLNREGLETSMIYAIDEGFVSNLVQSMKANKLKLVGISPISSTHTGIIQKILSSKKGNDFRDKTVAAINMSQHETYISVFHNQQLIHQRVDETILQDFYKEISEVLQIPIHSVENYCERLGLDKDNPQIVDAVATMMTRVIRSLSIILNSEELSLDQVILSGAPSAIPGLVELISNSLEDVKCALISDYKEALSKYIRFNGELRDRSDLFQSIVLLGGIEKKRKKHINFLSMGIKRKRQKGRVYAVCALLTILVIAIIAILPASYFIISRDYKHNLESINNPQYSRVQNLLEEKRKLEAELSQVVEERARLPYGDSNLSEHLNVIGSKLSPAIKINNIKYDHDSNTISIIADTDNLDAFLNLKNSIIENETYRISLPLTLDNDDGFWSFELKIEVLEAD